MVCLSFCFVVKFTAWSMGTLNRLVVNENLIFKNDNNHKKNVQTLLLIQELNLIVL